MPHSPNLKPPSVSPYHLTPAARAVLAQRSAEIRQTLAQRRAARIAAAAMHTTPKKHQRVLDMLAALRCGSLAVGSAGCTDLPGARS